MDLFPEDIEEPAERRFLAHIPEEYSSGVLLNKGGDSFVLPRYVDYIAKNRQGWLKPVMLPFNDANRKMISHRIARFSETFLEGLVEDPLDELIEPVRSNYHSFIVDLYAYSLEVPASQRPVELKTLHDRSLSEGPSYAKELDSFKSYILGRYSNREYFTDEIYKAFNYVAHMPEYVSASTIYRSNFLFWWKPARESIQLYSQLPVTKDDKVAEVFRFTVRQYLSKFSDLIEEEDWTTLVKGNMKSVFDGKNAFVKDEPPAKIRGRSRIAYIDRELKGARTACVEEYSSALRIRWIEMNLSNILDGESRNVMRASPGSLKANLERAIRGARRHDSAKAVRTSYCRDFQKEGLTKPRYILKILLEELFRKFEFECFKETGFFDDWFVEEDGVPIVTTRGHGLGMANSLTTLMSITIEEMVRQTSCIQPTWSGYNNDDAALVFSTKADAIRYAGIDRHICESLGLDFKDKASFIAEGEVVLCEQYARIENSTYGYKGSHYSMGFFNLLKCANVAHARFLASSTEVENLPDLYLTIVMRYWGWCLFRNEHTRSSYHGGWFKKRLSGINADYIDLEENSLVPRDEQAAKQAYRGVTLQFTPWDNRAYINRMYAHYDESYLDLIGFKRVELVKDHYIQQDSYEHKRAWDKYLEKLKEDFSRNQSLIDRGIIEQKRWVDLYTEDVQDHPELDFIPPRGYRTEISCREEVTCVNTAFRSPYGRYGMRRDHDLYVCREKVNEYNLSVSIGEIELGYNKTGVKSKGYRGSKERAKVLFPELQGTEWEAYIYPSHSSLEYYHDPFSVLKVCDYLGSEYKMYLPRTGFQRKDDLLLKRKLFYGRNLRIKEWIEIGNLRPIDQILMSLTSRVWRENESAYNLILSYARKYPGSGNFLNVAITDLPVIEERLIAHRRMIRDLQKKSVETPDLKVEVPKETTVPQSYRLIAELAEIGEDPLTPSYMEEDFDIDIVIDETELIEEDIVDYGQEDFDFSDEELIECEEWTE